MMFFPNLVCLLMICLFYDIINIMSCCVNFEVKFVRKQANIVVHIFFRAIISWTSFYSFESILLLFLFFLTIVFPFY
jgi:hypothetical protein